ncbi:hypothetical protein HIM_02206 [Hirsutella minnesotensis 3608]|nr:hypothetical protein HIM_02206 [Hirsutella minnesotensis 3608]
MFQREPAENTSDTHAAASTSPRTLRHPQPAPTAQQDSQSPRRPSSARESLVSHPAPVSPGPSSPPYSLFSAGQPGTPQAEEHADSYFENLNQTASSQSRTSNASAPRTRQQRPERSRRPSIRIRSSNNSIDRAREGTLERVSSSHGPNPPPTHRTRPRSISQPQSSSTSVPLSAPPPVASTGRRLVQASLPRLTEEGSRPTMAELGLADGPGSPLSLPHTPSAHHPDRAHGYGDATESLGSRPNRLRRVSRFLIPNFTRRGSVQSGGIGADSRDHRSHHDARTAQEEDEYHDELVDWLDIIDPEVQTLSTLTNVQNSLFVPDLGNWVNRRPMYVLSQPSLRDKRPGSAAGRIPEEVRTDEPEHGETQQPSEGTGDAPPLERTATITSSLSDSHYATLPHGETLEGWSAADKLELEDRVRHMLHSRRSKFKRTMKGFGQYVRRPLGFFVTLYATLITLFGLAWVLFLIGWIYVGEKQVYAIHIIDSVLVALFAIMGDGLAPFRAIDTYHLFFVVRYSRMIRKASKPPRKRLLKWRRRPKKPAEPQKEAASEAVAAAPSTTPGGELPQGHAYLDLQSTPEPGMSAADDLNEAAELQMEEGKSQTEITGFYPLSPKQVKSLLHHQKKLAKSHSFYKPEETYTHYSFPLDYLIAIVILLDFHSCLQISLGACTWGINYHHRPIAITTVILCVSITCNLAAGLVITIGDRKTRKKDVMKLLNRRELTGDAMARMQHKKKKREDRRREAIMDQMASA